MYLVVHSTERINFVFYLYSSSLSSTDAVAVRNARFSPNHAIPILMDNVFCTGSETQLVNCSYDPNTSEDSHFEDAGVRCFSENGNNIKLSAAGS